MPSTSSPRDSYRNGYNGVHRPAPAGRVDSALDLLARDENLRKEMERLAGPDPFAPQGDDETARLRAENAELRARVEEYEQVWAERQREYEALLEEKSEVIRALHQKVQDLGEYAPPERTAGGAPAGIGEDTLLELQRQLEEERSQLKCDEDALMEQMREMELAMSRERAEMARQRAELQRLHNDLNREMEMASRDSSLRDRLVSLQRRHQEVVRGKENGGGLNPSAPPGAAPPSPSENTPLPRKNSGLLGRLFG